jgi:quinol monooxygenase YgiN
MMNFKWIILLSSLVATHGLLLQPYCVNVRFSLQPDRRDEFLSLIQELQSETLELESAALQYTIGEDTTTPNVFHVHQQFLGDQGYDDHQLMPFKYWKKFSKSNPYVEEPEKSFFFGTHEPQVEPLRKGSYCVHAELCIPDEVRDDFLRVIQNNQKGSNQEELCHQYSYGECIDEPNKFIFHEEFQGKEGFDAHAVAPHFVAWEEFAATCPFTKPPKVAFFQTLQ